MKTGGGDSGKNGGIGDALNVEMFTLRNRTHTHTYIHTHIHSHHVISRPSSKHFCLISCAHFFVISLPQLCLCEMFVIIIFAGT